MKRLLSLEMANRVSACALASLGLPPTLVTTPQSMFLQSQHASYLHSVSTCQFPQTEHLEGKDSFVPHCPPQHLTQYVPDKDVCTNE